jgi:hypothetical protein
MGNCLSKIQKFKDDINTDVINKLFEPCYHYKLGTYRGKHILENELKRYVSEGEFIDIMVGYGYVLKNGKLKAKHII